MAGTVIAFDFLSHAPLVRPAHNAVHIPGVIHQFLMVELNHLRADRKNFGEVSIAFNSSPIIYPAPPRCHCLKGSHKVFLRPGSPHSPPGKASVGLRKWKEAHALQPFHAAVGGTVVHHQQLKVTKALVQAFFKPSTFFMRLPPAYCSLSSGSLYGSPIFF